MKTPVLTVIALLTFGFIRAQGYQHFAIEGAHWKQRSTYAPNAPDLLYPYGETTSWFKLEGDSLVDTLSYKQFYLSASAIYHFDQTSSVSNNSPWSLLGLIREDTLERKVFLRNLISGYCGPLNEDTLLFDFSKNIHDSVMISLSACPGCCLKDSFYIDTIDNAYHTPYTGYVRKTWFINQQADKNFTQFQLYEGIGTSFGFFDSPGPAFEGGWVSWLQSYCIGPDSICGRGYVYSGLGHDNKLVGLTLYPNPSTDNVFFNGVTPDNVYIFTVEGRETNCVYDKQSNTVDIRMLARGMYVAEIICGDKKQYSKIFKE
ncbi:MAG: T9SS type A sorting domain-containing protein [Chitinophagales bacterium]